MLHIKRRFAPSLDNDVFCLDTYVIRDKNCIGYCCQDPLNLEHKLRIASEAGYTAVELWHRDVSGYIQKKGLDQFLRVLEDNRLYVASYKVLEGWFDSRKHDLTVLETASSVQARCCVVKLIDKNYRGQKQDIDWYRSRYKELLDHASRLNVKPAIEFMCLAPFMNKIDDVYDILEGVSDPRASLVIDTWHLWRTGDAKFTDFERTLSRLQAEWVGVIHFTDARSDVPQDKQLDGDRKLPKLGCLDLPRFCDLIKSKAVYSLNVYDQSLWDEDPLAVAVKGYYLMQQCMRAGLPGLADSDNWRDKQKERCDGLWFRQYYTHLDPRIKETNRDKQLRELLSPLLAGKVCLDFKCGFSPLAEYMTYGFDAFQGCIDYLNKKYPQAIWTCESDEEFADRFDRKLDILLHIGIGDSNTEVESHMKIRQRCKPSLVIIECAANPDGTVNESKPGNTARWNLLKKDLVNAKEHVIHTDMAERSHRLLLIGELC